jgi:DNA-directed RNA polymerase subunit RPC12/RpoP
MFINCNPKCKRGTTTASFDSEKNEAVCNYCGDIIAVSNFAKENMKRNGDILKKVEEKTQAYQYDCMTCNKTMPAALSQDKIIGKNCKGDCKFNMTEFTAKLVKETLKNSEREDE